MAQPTLYIQDLKEKPRGIVWNVREYYKDIKHLDSKLYWVVDPEHNIALISTNIISGREVIERAKYRRGNLAVPSGSSVDEVKLIIETFIKADIKGEAS